MAEVRKRVVEDKYNTEKIKKSLEKKKNTKKTNKKGGSSKKNKKVVVENKNFITRFRIFCHGVKSEFEKIHWPSKKDMIKYSIATLCFIVFMSVFFYLIDVIFALVQSLFA